MQLKDRTLDIKILLNEMLCLVGKKTFTVKNTIISTVQKFVLFVGLSTQGSFHDYALLKEEFPPEFDWFSTFENWIDLGYLGIEKDYKPFANIVDEEFNLQMKGVITHNNYWQDDKFLKKLLFEINNILNRPGIDPSLAVTEDTDGPHIS